MESIHLQQSNVAAIKNAYRSLPKQGQITLIGSAKKLSELICNLETCGFLGIEISPFQMHSEQVHLRAFKGKQGPCYDTGRSASYKGAALAGLDDDQHLVFKNDNLAVCEKTANVYQFPAYQQLIDVSDADADLMACLADSPKAFDCDTYESDLKKCYEQTKETRPQSELDQLYYPGPFKALILDDGTILKRGQNNAVPKTAVKSLIQSDACFRLENVKENPLLSFPNIYDSKGSSCLMDDFDILHFEEVEGVVDYSTLNNLSSAIITQLNELIDLDKEYFILTGSDPEDKLGCCPSEDVGQANQLLEAGVLSRFSKPVPEGGCPISFYAFKGEISIDNNKPVFIKNETMRQAIHSHLNQNNTLKNFIKFVLIAFVLISCFVALLNIIKKSKSPEPVNIYNALSLKEENITVLVLYHKERCELCLNLENFSKELLKEKYPNIQLKLINLETKGNEWFEANYLVSLELIKFNNKEIKKKKLFDDIQTFYRDKKKFQLALSHSIDAFHKDEND